MVVIMIVAMILVVCLRPDSTVVDFATSCLKLSSVHWK